MSQTAAIFSLSSYPASTGITPPNNQSDCHSLDLGYSFIQGWANAPEDELFNESLKACQATPELSFEIAMATIAVALDRGLKDTVKSFMLNVLQHHDTYHDHMLS